MSSDDKPPDDPGGGGEVSTDGSTDNTTYASVTDKDRLGQETMTAAKAVGGVTGGRSWKQIVEDAKKQNILQITINKTSKIVNGETVKPRNLKHDDIATFLFDVLGIKAEDCLGFDYNTGRYDTREIQMKNGIDTTRFLRVEPVEFMEHEIRVSALNTRSTKVTFRNVPLNVPDEELLHLAYHYGKPVDNRVTREVLNNDKNRGMRGSTRFIEMNLDEGKSFLNYYWMEGPLPGDRGRRVTVTHGGQVQQCSHCLQRAGMGCPAAGNGYNCEKSGTKRAMMKEYMQQVRTKTGYVSLKIREAEAEARRFPPLYIENLENNEIFGMEEDLVDSNNEPIVFRNPVEEKDSVIQEKEKQISRLEKVIQDQEKAASRVQNKATTAENSLTALRSRSKDLMEHLSRSKAVVEMKLIEKIREESFDPTVGKDEIGFEVTTVATLLLDEEIDNMNDQEKKRNFFIKMKDKLDTDNKVEMEKFEEVKKLVQDRHLSLRQHRGRRLSLSKRQRSGSDEGERSSSRQRTNE